MMRFGPVRIFWVASALFLGVIPSLIFFYWIERNCTIPLFLFDWVSKEGWPWISLAARSLFIRIAWDIGLIWIFGFFHSYLAQPHAQNRLLKVLPAASLRAFYLSFTGVSVLGIMLFWQNTGLVVWILPLSYQTLQIVSMVGYWVPLGIAGVILSGITQAGDDGGFQVLRFLGFRQIYEGNQTITAAQSQKLVTTGLYRYVRHPAYVFTLIAILAAPFMSLDRLIVFGAVLSYLFIGIPVEERKLIGIFGSEYADYRSRVPALVPFLFRFRFPRPHPPIK